ncbi:signal peptidase I [Microbacterium sp. 13-71-7]|uniref:signal peptidase I n=1 Tax=Microbacterium sp. 13-71-7 TaxID=1970399 RepID=UPI0025F0C2F5|nr:signal peptidase I [Microbacterium sp. 13-71-7]
MTQATTPAPLTRRAQRESGTTAPRPRPTARGVLSEVLLWVAALAGLICIVLVVLAFTAHITLIMFRTGSMSPTIPAGSVAVVQQIPAAQVHVGDVVTVDRPGQLPVTHRVRVVEDGASPAQRLITLRGDANAQDDPAPYPVSTVRIVRFAIPGLAPVIVAFGNPFVLGGLTLGATALVIWAFWPRTGGRARKVDETTAGDPVS